MNESKIKTYAELFKEFANLGSRHALCSKNGNYYEGYVLEIGEESFKFVSEGR